MSSRRFPASRRGRRALALAVSAALTMGAADARAATIPVGCSTLQGYLDSGPGAAQPGDVLQLSGTCTGQSFTISNTNPFTLAGNGTSGFTGGAPGEPILQSGVDVQLTISNLIFKAGAAPRGAAIDIESPGAAPQIVSNTFYDNRASGDGGAVYLDTSSVTGALIDHNTFVNSTPIDFGNTAGGDGGAVYLTGDGAYVVSSNRFFASQAQGHGGALAIVESSTTSTNPVTLSANQVGNNSLGGIWGFFPTGNESRLGGGGVYIQATAPHPLTLDHNLIILNRLFGDAGAADRVGGGIEITGAASAVPPAVTQIYNDFEFNTIAATGTASRIGGAAEWLAGMNLTGTGDRYLSNGILVPGGRGGAIGAEGAGPSMASSLQLADDVVIGNTASAPAAGAGVYSGTPAGCTDPTCPGQAAIVNSTIWNNTIGGTDPGTGSAGVSGTGDGALTIQNGIVWGNTAQAGSSSQPDVGSFGSRSVMFSDVCARGGLAALTGAGNICADPQLQSSGDEQTLSFVTGRPGLPSPTIDAGSNALVPATLLVDYLGRPRIADGLSSGVARVDMGAFESPGAPPPPAFVFTPSPGGGSPPPATPPTAKPPAATAVKGERTCRSRRSIVMHFRPPRGQRWRSLTVRALGKKLKVRKRPLLWVAVISLHGLHKDLYVVTAEGRTRSGKRVRLRTRRYHTCNKKLPGHVPKHKKSKKK